jgi:hypothetical protein
MGAPDGRGGAAWASVALRAWTEERHVKWCEAWRQSSAWAPPFLSHSLFSRVRTARAHLRAHLRARLAGSAQGGTAGCWLRRSAWKGVLLVCSEAGWVPLRAQGWWRGKVFLCVLPLTSAPCSGAPAHEAVGRRRWRGKAVAVGGGRRGVSRAAGALTNPRSRRSLSGRSGSWRARHHCGHRRRRRAAAPRPPAADTEL